MSRRKRRPFTAMEREEVSRLCYRGKLGKLGAHEAERCGELYAISPDEYGEIGAEARKAAVRTVNPLADKGDTDAG